MLLIIQTYLSYPFHEVNLNIFPEYQRQELLRNHFSGPATKPRTRMAPSTYTKPGEPPSPQTYFFKFINFSFSRCSFGVKATSSSNSRFLL